MFDRFTRVCISSDVLIIGCIVGANLLFHMILPEYGYHRDELYYVAIADGFSFANLDMPPGAPLFLKIFLMLFGHSIKSVHLAASACGAMVIVFGCLIAKEFGGKRYALLLTGSFLMLSGLAIFGSIYTYDDPSFVVWAGVLYLIAKMLNGADQRLWIVAGILLGLGMMTKLTVLFLGFAIFVALWLLEARVWYKRPWIWLGAVLAVAGAVPYALWQRAHEWYFLSYAASYSGRTTFDSPILAFLWHQMLPNNLILVPVWCTGLLFLLFGKAWARYRFFGLAYLILCAAIFFLGGQFYFMMPIYCVLVAAGSVRIEQWLAAHSSTERPRRALRVAIPVIYALLSLPALPLFIPILPVDALVRYVKPIGVTAGVKTQDRQITDLPQHMADRFGWEEMVRAVAGVYHQEHSASPEPIGVTAGNWGEASAIHVYRDEFSLPEPVSGDGWYYFEGLRIGSFLQKYVAIGVSRSQMQSLFRHVQLRAVFTHPHCMPDETNNEIYLCSDPKVNLQKYWRILKKMDPRLADTLRIRGVEQAIAYYHRRRKEEPDAVLFTEWHLNALGYAYLDKHQVKDAIALFQLNVEAFPESSNAYDSLGEALMADQQYPLAFQNYVRSLELNPCNENGRKKLEDLKALGRPRPGA